MGKVITIDGPAASGKTSVSRELAKRYGWSWVSTGAFYRGLAYAALQEGLDSQDEKALAQLATSSIWSVNMTQESTTVMYRASDVTDDIAKEEVGALASQISHFATVRQALLRAQRNCAQSPKTLVAEGRDCGTVVFPGAELKVYLTAGSSSRAERRAKQFGLDKETTEESQKIRDQQDSQRKAAPLQIPAEALVIDSSSMGLEQVVDTVQKHLEEHFSGTF